MAYRPWFLGASIVLLGVGILQVARPRPACPRRSRASIAIWALCAAVVLLVLLFPQAIATFMADWLA